MQENNYFIISSELPKKMNVYLEQEHTEDAAGSKKSIKVQKTLDGRQNDLKRRQEYEWQGKETGEKEILQRVMNIYASPMIKLLW